MVNINSNWIKLFSKFTEWEWYKDQNTKDLFVHCLLKANWKDGKFQGVDVPRGSFVTGRKQLAEELGISEQSIRTSINKLKSTNEITTKSTNKFTIITVVNYGEYQKKKEELTSETTNTATFNQPTTNQQLTTIEEYKNNRILEDSVCITHACEENFSCHLGCNYKTINCKDCMKKYMCPLPDDPMFKGIYGQTFYEYMKDLEERRVETAKQFESMQASPPVGDMSILDDYDYLDEGDELYDES